MGNALNFQERITNALLYEETQNFQGYWTEIGAILNLVWDFQPLEQSAMEKIGEGNYYDLIE